MMITNIFTDPMDHHAVQLVLSLKVRFLADGGDPAEFPKFLKEQGVYAAGPFIRVDDSFITMSKLTHS